MLPGLTRNNEFGFGNRQKDVVLTSALPRDRSGVHHNDEASVRAASISIAGPICVDPSPELIWFPGATSVSDRLIPSVTEQLQDVFSCLHVCDLGN